MALHSIQPSVASFPMKSESSSREVSVIHALQILRSQHMPWSRLWLVNGPPMQYRLFPLWEILSPVISDSSVWSQGRTFQWLFRSIVQLVDELNCSCSIWMWKLGVQLFLKDRVVKIGEGRSTYFGMHTALRISLIPSWAISEMRRLPLLSSFRKPSFSLKYLPEYAPNS